MSSSGSEAPAFVGDQALASFVVLAQFLGVPADPEQIHHDRGQGDQPYAFADLVRIAKKLDLIAKIKKAPLLDLAKLPLPALVRLKDDGCASLLKVDERGDVGDRYMILRAGAERPEIWDEERITSELAVYGEFVELLPKPRLS